MPGQAVRVPADCPQRSPGLGRQTGERWGATDGVVSEDTEATGIREVSLSFPVNTGAPAKAGLHILMGGS